MTTYKTLDAWKRSMELVIEIYGSTKTFPKEELYSLTSQIRRASVSVPTNIAEGLGRNHRKETIQFLHVSRGSLYELETLLNIANKIDVLSETKFNELSITIDACVMMVNGLVRYFERASFK